MEGACEGSFEPRPLVTDPARYRKYVVSSAPSVQTAKDLRLTIPPSMLALAGDLIQ
jgi:hypothetical protein